jgi:hypothetical protein
MGTAEARSIFLLLKEKIFHLIIHHSKSCNSFFNKHYLSFFHKNTQTKDEFQLPILVSFPIVNSIDIHKWGQ